MQRTVIKCQCGFENCAAMATLMNEGDEVWLSLDTRDNSVNMSLNRTALKQLRMGIDNLIGEGQ